MVSGGEAEGRTVDGGDVDIFLGTFHHGLDAKGRVVLPSDFRSSFGAQAVIFPGADHIAVYTVGGFRRFLTEEVTALADGAGTTIGMRQRLAQAAQNVTVDPQGRVVVPAGLREYFGIEGNARVVGCFDHVGIYPEADVSIDDVVSFMSELGDVRAQ